MLTKLYIFNFSIINKAELDLAGGLTNHHGRNQSRQIFTYECPLRAYLR